jgi:hypothetical protein
MESVGVGVAHTAARTGADRDALVHEHRGGLVPTVVQLAEQPALRDATSVKKISLKCLPPSIWWMARISTAGGLHVDDEHRDAGVLDLPRGWCGRR